MKESGSDGAAGGPGFIAARLKKKNVLLSSSNMSPEFLTVL